MTEPTPLTDRVADFLVQMDIDPDRNDENIFLLKYGSTVVMISIFEEAGHEYVRMASTLLVGARVQLELVLRLLRLNTEVLFGAFILFEDDTVSFTHTLLGDGLTFEAFAHALHYVAQVSDDHDEDLQSLAGGRRAEEILADEA
jgi:hypothetical protein